MCCSDNSEKSGTLPLSESYLLSENIQGNWIVEQRVSNSNEYKNLGTLTITEDSYEFTPLANPEYFLLLSSRFVFFDKTSGTIAFEYMEEYSPNYDLRNLQEEVSLLTCHGLGSGTGINDSFLIRNDPNKKELYLHLHHPL